MKELYKALASFQAEVPHIYKGASGYGYKFADLGEINEIIKPLLTKNGLGYVQPLDGESLKTIIFHVASGESIESSVLIPQGVQLAKMNEFQVLGSAITYLRRYSLSSMLGLITDEDADAAGEQVKQSQKSINDNLAIVKQRNKDKEVRNRQEEAQAGSEPMGMEGDTEGIEEFKSTLARAKVQINEMLEAHDYTRSDQKKAFISIVLEKATIDTIDDANAVADALDNEGDDGINQDGSYNK